MLGRVHVIANGGVRDIERCLLVSCRGDHFLRGARGQFRVERAGENDAECEMIAPDIGKTCVADDHV